MKILYFSGEPWEEEYVRTKLPNDDIVFYEKPFVEYPELSDPDATVLSIFMESHIGEAELNRFPSLKLIATRSTGFDHIDLAAAKAHGITIVNVPSYGENTVAEFAFGLILALSRRIIEADERVRTTGLFSPNGLRGFDLAGKTLGVVGTGRIGQHIITMANGFGMKVIGFDAYPNEERTKTLNFTYTSLSELLAASDIITLHVPYNEQTHHLINRDNIATIKKGAFLVNTARGAVIDTEALIDALQKEILAGAALDVLENECELNDEVALLTAPHPQEEEIRIALANNYLIEHPRVIVTPHVAFNTIEAITRIVDTTLENIQEFESGAPKNTVTN